MSCITVVWDSNGPNIVGKSYPRLANSRWLYTLYWLLVLCLRLVLWKPLPHLHNISIQHVAPPKQVNHISIRKVDWYRCSTQNTASTHRIWDVSYFFVFHFFGYTRYFLLLASILLRVTIRAQSKVNRVTSNTSILNQYSFIQAKWRWYRDQISRANFKKDFIFN